MPLLGVTTTSLGVTLKIKISLSSLLPLLIVNFIKEALSKVTKIRSLLNQLIGLWHYQIAFWELYFSLFHKKDIYSEQKITDFYLCQVNMTKFLLWHSCSQDSKKYCSLLWIRLQISKLKVFLIREKERNQHGRFFWTNLKKVAIALRWILSFHSLVMYRHYKQTELSTISNIQVFFLHLDFWASQYIIW